MILHISLNGILKSNAGPLVKNIHAESQTGAQKIK
jgi:hypothetical protein